MSISPKIYEPWPDQLFGDKCCPNFHSLNAGMERSEISIRVWIGTSELPPNLNTHTQTQTQTQIQTENLINLFI